MDLLDEEPEIVQTGSPPFLKCALAAYAAVHLMPGSEEQAAGLLDAYLERANTAARAAQIA